MKKQKNQIQSKGFESDLILLYLCISVDVSIGEMREKL